MLLNEIQWSEPIVPQAHDAQWEAELKRRGSQVLEVDRRVAPSRWLRETAYEAANYLPAALPERLYRIGNMVTAQENSCRYCYGANRAYMKVLGYSESFIQRVERDVQMAELDDKERARWRGGGGRDRHRWPVEIQRHGRPDQRRLAGRRTHQQVSSRPADHGGHPSPAR
jgi:hypothetical protein